MEEILANPYFVFRLYFSYFALLAQVIGLGLLVLHMIKALTKHASYWSSFLWKCKEIFIFKIPD